MDIQVTYISTNARGQQQRDQRRVSGETFNVGRGTQCQIHLPDSRVALDHAHIIVGTDHISIEATAGNITVNGRAVQSAKLAVGDHIEIDPYVIEVEAPPANVPLALSVKLGKQAPTSRGTLRRALLRTPQVSKRRLSYLAFFATLVLALLIPAFPSLFDNHPSPEGHPQPISRDVMNDMGAKFQQVWDPGPLSPSHQILKDNCRACHELPFIQVRDQACIACHTDIKEHVPVAELTGSRGAQFAEQRCTDCHKDHKGKQMAPRTQEQCADCHSDIKSFTANGATENVTDFASGHPQFRLAMLDADKPNALIRVRQATPEPATLKEHSNLKFDHKLHLDAGGVRDPEGKRDPNGTHDANGNRTVLQCANCHTPEPNGARMAPVTFEKACQRCHTLAFEPQVTTRQVPHGEVQDIATMLREFYSRLALGDVPPGVNPPGDLPRMRPGAVLTYQDRQRVLQIADTKAHAVMNELFGKREVCTTCHEVTRTDDAAGWKIAPVKVTSNWMPEANFTHAKHATEPCASCHNVINSKKSEDVDVNTLPEIKKLNKYKNLEEKEIYKMVHLYMSI